MRKVYRLSFAFVVFLFLTACESNILKNARPIDDVHNLDGQRVGVLLSWAPDYLLTGRKDMTLMRYNNLASMILALSYNRIDAIAIDYPLVPNIFQCVSGLYVVDEPISEDSLVVFVNKNRTDLYEQLNEFISRFRTTETYKDIHNRFSSTEVFEPKRVKATGNGPVLSVAVVEDYMPFAYLDFETDEYVGSDIEFITHFANEYNYTLKLYPGPYEAATMSVINQRNDMVIGCISKLYAKDEAAGGKVLVPEYYMTQDIVFIEVADRDSLKILSSIVE